MKASPHLLLCLLAAPLLCRGEAPSPGGAQLRWRNGESLPGELVSATAAAVVWKSELFAEPLPIQWSALRQVDRDLPPESPDDAFAITCRDGSHFYGNITAISADAVTILSDRHGAAELKRDRILSLRRVRGGELLAGASTGSANWTEISAPGPSQDGGKRAPALSTGPGGALNIRYWNRGGVFTVELKDSLDLEVDLRSSERPAFQLCLGRGRGEDQFRIETWDEDLVVAAGNEFQAIGKLRPEDRAVALRICWDKKARRCLIFSPNGVKLVEWQLPEAFAEAAPDIRLVNKGADLSLPLFRLREWTGARPTRLGPPQPRVELANGRTLEGEVLSAAEEVVMVRDAVSEKRSAIPLEEVDAIIFSAEDPEAPAGGSMLSLADGSVLYGKLAGVDGDAIRMEVPFCDTPFATSLDAVRRLLISTEAPAGEPLQKMDLLVLGKTELHGALALAGGSAPKWLPIGGETPVALVPGSPYEIRRAFPADAVFPAAPALFYTAAGDVISGELRGLDERGADLASDLVQTPRLDVPALYAVQLSAPSRLKIDGFSDPAWQVIKGGDKVKREGDKLTLEQDTAVALPGGSVASRIDFKLNASKNGSFAVVRIRLFCASGDGAGAFSTIVGRIGSQVMIMEDSGGGIGGNTQEQTNVPSDESAVVSLRLAQDKVQVWINEMQITEFTVEPEKRKGSGIVLEPASLWGNGIYTVELSGFTASSAPGIPALPAVDAAAKAQALSIPRFRRDSPPVHALLGGNGDLLRGVVEAATATHLGFRSGLEMLSIPRDRVKAIVWLGKPLAGVAPAAAVPSPAEAILNRPVSRGGYYPQCNVDTFINVMGFYAPGVKLKYIGKANQRMQGMEFKSKTVRDVLAKFCAVFDMRYSIDNEGTIVLEDGAEPELELMERSYAVKSDLIPAPGAAQEFLEAKSIAFPKGASAGWNAGGRRLRMLNTAANHAQLAEVLGAEIIPGANCWVQLTNGARLGLRDSAFDADFIRAEDPVYGRCQIPAAQISVIRSTPPEANTTMLALAGWQLAFAPEPTLPDGDGESSPQTGKQAAPFKLALLEGGDFELSAQKGKVVVLDFWATWCGPCIKALPGLIEAMSGFSTEQVKLIGVNQSEPKEQVQRFLEARKWKLSVAMDAGQGVGRKYGVDGIPHTVIVGPDGKIAWAKTGYDPDGATEAADAVKKLLGEMAAKN